MCAYIYYIVAYMSCVDYLDLLKVRYLKLYLLYFCPCKLKLKTQTLHDICFLKTQTQETLHAFAILPMYMCIYIYIYIEREIVCVYIIVDI